MEGESARTSVRDVCFLAAGDRRPREQGPPDIQHRRPVTTVQGTHSSVACDVHVSSSSDHRIAAQDAIQASCSSVLYGSISSRHVHRCIANFFDKTGFAVGSIEGRVGIQYVDEKNAQSVSLHLSLPASILYVCLWCWQEELRVQVPPCGRSSIRRQQHCLPPQGHLRHCRIRRK